MASACQRLVSYSSHFALTSRELFSVKEECWGGVIALCGDVVDNWGPLAATVQVLPSNYLEASLEPSSKQFLWHAPVIDLTDRGRKTKWCLAKSFCQQYEYMAATWRMEVFLEQIFLYLFFVKFYISTKCK